MNGPEYPTLAGRSTPDLGLAQYATPTPPTASYLTSATTGPLQTALPPLQDSDIASMGLEPDVPYFDLALANAFEVPDPDQLAAPLHSVTSNVPTSSQPDTSMPELTDGDPSTSMAELYQSSPADDSWNMSNHPGSLDIVTASDDPLSTSASQMCDYDPTNGLDIQTDTSWPDLQDPDMLPQVHMQDRPGDLAQDALASMHADPTYRQLPDSRYPALWMQQHGDNQKRSRHQGMLMLGLDQEENQA